MTDKRIYGVYMDRLYDDENSMYRRFVAYDEDREDGEFLKSLYPVEIMDLQLVVEDKCDELEYDGSIMFDEYPDKLRINRIADKIVEKDKRYDRNLVEVLIINEMLRRRIRRRNCRARGFC